MNGEALGIIEAIGMAAAVEAADTCVKSANVELVGYELTKGSGLVVIKIRGNVGAVKAAIEAAKISASRVNKVYATLIIPRPSADLERIIKEDIKEDTKEDIKENIEEINEDVKEGIEEEAKEDSEKDIEVDAKENIQEEIKEDTREDSEENISKNINEDITEEVEEDIEEYTELVEVNNLYGNGQEDENKVYDNSSLNEESDDICNICHDPRCQRKKGQPRNLCIHYKRA